MGKHLYLSEIYEIVETTDGVTDSNCKFDDKDKYRQVVTAGPDQSVFLMENSITLTESRYIP